MKAMRTTRVYLVRHGMTDWNRRGRLQGLLDTPLNAEGLRQAHALATRFDALADSLESRGAAAGSAGSAAGASRVIASPLARARATADVVSNRLAIPLDTDARLLEIDHGAWTGQTMAEIASRHPDAVDDDGHLQGDAPAVVRAESLAAVYRRASSLLADLLDSHPGQSLIIVGHGVTNALLFGAAAGCDAAHLHAPPAPNAGGMVMTFRGRQLSECRAIPLAGRP